MLGLTALHYAAAHNVDAVMALLQVDAIPDVRDEMNWTALHHAAVHGNADTVTALLQAGIDPRARDKQGQRPIDLANKARKLTGPAYQQLNDVSFH